MDGLRRCEVLRGQTEAFLTASTWLLTKVQNAPLTGEPNVSAAAGSALLGAEERGRRTQRDSFC